MTAFINQTAQLNSSLSLTSSQALLAGRIFCEHSEGLSTFQLHGGVIPSSRRRAHASSAQDNT